MLLLISCVAPAMACMQPNVQMSAQERACCRMMKSHCGEMQMSASHGCCHKTLQSVQDNALNAKTVMLQPVAAIAGSFMEFELAAPNPTFSRWLERPEHSPPQSSSAVVSILRV